VILYQHENGDRLPKPEITIVEHVDKTKKCSYCKETGHEKSRKGEIICPMMPK
jgi:hypothetical protein